MNLSLLESFRGSKGLSTSTNLEYKNFIADEEAA
jgi:hypothetical protein